MAKTAFNHQFAMLKNYLRTAFRDLLANKLYWIINSLGLSVGVAVTLLLYQYVSYEFSYDRFYERDGDIYRILTQQEVRNEKTTSIRTSYLLAPALKEEFPQVELAAGAQSANVTLEHGEKKLFDIKSYFVHEDLPEILELNFLEGFSKSAFQGPNSIIIDEDLAEKLFDTKVGVTGRVIQLNSHFNGQSEVMIAGVFKNFSEHSHLKSNAFISMNTLDNRNFVWVINNCETYVRLKSGIAADELQNETKAFIDKHPINRDGNFRTVLEYQFFPVSDIYLSDDPQQMGKGNKKAVLTFIVFGILILLTACSNYMNLAAARFGQKVKSIGMRKVIGAHRHQIIKQVIVEALLLSISVIFMGGLMAEMGSILFKEITDTSINIGFMDSPFRLIGFALFVGTAITISSLYPALQLSKVKVSSALRGNSLKGHKGKYIRRILVAFQFIVSGGLIISTVVIHKQMQYVFNKDLGFDPSDVITVELPKDQAAAELFKNDLEQNPRIASMSVSSVAPGGFQYNRKLAATTESGEDILERTSYYQIDEHFIDNLQHEIVLGEGFGNLSEPRTGRVIINESYAKRMGWENPLEHSIGIFSYETGNSDEKAKVIGVVKDFNLQNLYRSIRPFVFFQLDAFPENQRFLHLKLHEPVTPEISEQIKAAYDKVEKNQLYVSWSLEDGIKSQYKNDELRSQIFLTLTFISVFIASLGLFGLAFFSVNVRTKEIAIRKVLGSSILGLIKVLSKELLVIILISFAISFPIALTFMKEWLQTFAYRVAIGSDIFILATLATVLIAVISVMYQAFKTTRINPAQTLKTE